MDTKNNLHGKKILLVDDNSINRAIFKACLSRYGCIFDEVYSGQSAITFLEKNNVDIIIMDIQMPEMNGIETTRIIRNTLYLNTPIIAISSSKEKKEIEQFINCGMNDIIHKPFNHENILEILGKYCLKNETPMHQHENSLYNLNYLIQITHGDTELINEIIDLFCEIIPIEINKIKTAYKNGQLFEFKQLIHKIKPNINNFKIEKLTEIVQLLDDISNLEDFKSSTISESIQLLEDILQTVISDLLIQRKK